MSQRAEEITATTTAAVTFNISAISLWNYSFVKSLRFAKRLLPTRILGEGVVQTSLLRWNRIEFVL